jgi:hypothetical protein
MIARIHYLTEGGFPEVYPVERRFTDRRARTWLRIRIPMRPRQRTGWVLITRASATGPQAASSASTAPTTPA